MWRVQISKIDYIELPNIWRLFKDESRPYYILEISVFLLPSRVAFSHLDYYGHNIWFWLCLVSPIHKYYVYVSQTDPLYWIGRGIYVFFLIVFLLQSISLQSSDVFFVFFAFMKYIAIEYWTTENSKSRSNNGVSQTVWTRADTAQAVSRYLY